MKIDTRLTIGNTTALKFLENFISNLSFVTGYPPYIESPQKVCKNEKFEKYITLVDTTHSLLSNDVNFIIF